MKYSFKKTKLEQPPNRNLVVQVLCLFFFKSGLKISRFKHAGKHKHKITYCTLFWLLTLTQYFGTNWPRNKVTTLNGSSKEKNPRSRKMAMWKFSIQFHYPLLEFPNHNKRRTSEEATNESVIINRLTELLVRKHGLQEVDLFGKVGLFCCFPQFPSFIWDDEGASRNAVHLC